MSETLWILLTAGAESGAPLPWARVDGAGRVTARGLDPADRLPAGLPRKAVLAADRLLWTRLPLPGGRPLRGAALAYALEDRLIDEPEAVHAVAGGPAADATAPVAVVSRAWLADALRPLAAGRPAAILPEPALVAAAEASWTLLWTAQPWLLTATEAVRLDPDRDAALHLLAVALAGRAAPARLELRAEPGHSPPDAELWGQTLGIPVVPGPAYDWAAAAGQAAAGKAAELDLARGEFAAGPGLRLDRRAWRPAAWLAATLLAVNGLGFLAGQGLRAWEAHSLREAGRARFLAAFPDTRVVVDPLLQMRRKLAELRHAAGEAAPTDFAVLLARAGALLPADSRARAREIVYAGGRLTLVLPAGEPDAGRWAAAGLGAERAAGAPPGYTAWRVEARP